MNRCVRLNEGRHQEGSLKRRARGGEEVGCAHLDPEFGQSSLLELVQLNANSILFTQNKPTQSKLSTPSSLAITKDIESQASNLNTSTTKSSSIPSIQQWKYNSYSGIPPFRRSNRFQVSNLNTSTAKSSPFGSIASISNRYLCDPKQISSRPLCYTYFFGRLSTRNFSPPSIRRAMA